MEILIFITCQTTLIIFDIFILARAKSKLHHKLKIKRCL